MEDLMQRLPHDVLADVLRRLETPRLLAASRCVAKTWRAVIDTHGLLRADLLPLCLSGIFTHLNDETPPHYLAHPEHSSMETPAAFDYLDTDDQAEEPLMVLQHCNGLLLLDSERVLNPATRQWARLPSPPPLCLFGADEVDGYDDLDEHEDRFLVFDPTVSPHYQVLLINSLPYIPSPHCQVVKDSTMEKQWPPSSYTLRVFSSQTRLWEKKQFMRQGEARGTVGDMIWSPNPNYYYAAYWRGALYVNERDFVMRLSLSEYAYQVIELPRGDLEDDEYYLGKSNGGVNCALFKGYGGFGLQVWFLDETCGHMKWALKRHIDLRPLLLDEEDMTKNGRRYLSILGFHPYKEIIFIPTPSKRVMAYQFNSSEAQDLGYLPMDEHRIYCSFPYTPCRMGELSSNM